MDRLWLGDWFIMMQLCKNINQEVFHHIVLDLEESVATLEVEGNISQTTLLLEKQSICFRLKIGTLFKNHSHHIKVFTREVK